MKTKKYQTGGKYGKKHSKMPMTPQEQKEFEAMKKKRGGKPAYGGEAQRTRFEEKAFEQMRRRLQGPAL